MGPRLLLAKFAWREATVTALRAALTEAAGLNVFRAIESDQTYAYVAQDAPAELARMHAILRAVPEASVSRLERLMDIAGASAGEPAPFHYVVETDVLEAREDDFNAWYDGEHLPGLASVDGTVWAMRYRNVAGSPRYHACYDLTRPETLGSPAWLAVRGTPWSDRVRPAFRNTTRRMFRRVG